MAPDFRSIISGATARVIRFDTHFHHIANRSRSNSVQIPKRLLANAWAVVSWFGIVDGKTHTGTKTVLLGPRGNGKRSEHDPGSHLYSPCVLAHRGVLTELR